MVPVNLFWLGPKWTSPGGLAFLLTSSNQSRRNGSHQQTLHPPRIGLDSRPMKHSDVLVGQGLCCIATPAKQNFYKLQNYILASTVTKSDNCTLENLTQSSQKNRLGSAGALGRRPRLTDSERLNPQDKKITQHRPAAMCVQQVSSQHRKGCR